MNEVISLSNEVISMSNEVISMSHEIISMSQALGSKYRGGIFVWSGNETSTEYSVASSVTL